MFCCTNRIHFRNKKYSQSNDLNVADNEMFFKSLQEVLEAKRKVMCTVGMSRDPMACVTQQ
jgi:hypothetical protein